MGYIATPTGNYRKLTNISSGFNGVTTTFQLSVPPGTSAYYVTPRSTFQLIISVGGVIQEPGVDYTLNLSQITFTTAPAAGLSFFGLLLGDALNIGVPSDGTVTAAKLSPTGGLVGQTFVLNNSGQFVFGTAGGASGGVSGSTPNQVFYENDQTVVADYTITTNKNAVTAGPVTIQTGNTVTVPSGSYWSIV
jgi:hypothetical protein